MAPGTRMKPGTVIAVVLLAIVAVIGLGWLFVVPQELKTILGFSRWHDAHVRASGYVEREPAGTRVYWEEFGKADGPPVVVLPAGLCTITVMGGQIVPLDAESYRVIAIDSRGTGKSSNTAPALTYEMMSDDVVAVMDALKIERADIVGWSDGGNLGLDLARRYPDRVRKVVAFGANHTPLVLLPYATEMKNAIPGARLEIIADGTHEVPLAAPDAVNPIMLSFLKEEH